MTTVERDTIAGGAALHDDTLDAVVHLTGDGAVPLLAAAVGATGAQLGEASITQVSHEPGEACTVSYAAQLLWPDGRRSDETFVAATTRQGPTDGAAVLTSGEPQVGVWRYPFAPGLPGLADAVHEDRLAVRLGAVGPGPWRCRVVSYRPGRRAVVRAESPHRVVFVKLLRPAKAPALVLRHQLLHAAGLPVPELLAADPDDGFMVLDTLAGEVLRERLLDGPSFDVHAMDRVARPLMDLLERLGDVELDGRPARRRPLDDVTAHVGVIASVLPDQAARVHELLERLRVHDEGPAQATGSSRTVHGDLHDAQLMVDAAGNLTGLLDLDDAGTGVAADDLANLWGHAATMAQAAPDSAGVRAWLGAARRLVHSSDADPDEVARRAAAATLSLATGPFRVREPGWQQATRARIGAAAALLADVREVSDSHHGGLIAVDEN